MVTVSEAERLVLENVGRLPAEKCPLKNAAGRILRQPVKADRAGPPFDRATLDGVCLRHAEWAAGRREFSIAGVQAAGAEPLAAPPEGACLEIMTGAPVPAPCDCVLRLEDFDRIEDAGCIRARDGAVLESGSGIHAHGGDFVAGDVLVAPGRRLTGREIAVAASCGQATLDVTVQPKIAVLTTGDELVEIDDEPKPHQIRRSNDLALRAVLAAKGWTNIELDHLPDNPQAISWNLERLVQQADVIVITGGVSKGRFDFIPGVLRELGVKEHFHGVAQRPGKPMWFGTLDRPGDFLHPEDTRVVAVFALPGNPVSAFTCAHRYVLPAIDAMGGIERPGLREQAFLAEPAQPLSKLTHFVPIALSVGGDGRLMGEVRPCNTSGDFASVVASDGFVEIEPAAEVLPAGAAVRLWRWS